MRIRKQYKFEGAHIVRNCSSTRCKYSIHGHSYIVEVFLKSYKLDKGFMIYDFGLLKENVGKFIDMFDHTIVLWADDNEKYLEAMTEHSSRYIILPGSPSAEFFSVFFLKSFQLIFDELVELKNGEGPIVVDSVIVHETATGYAESVNEDLRTIGKDIDLTEMVVSDEIFMENADFLKKFRTAAMDLD